MAYIDVEPIIPNTTMRKYINNSGREISYNITPNEGYVLHDNDYNFPVVDEETMQEIGTGLGYTRTTVSVALSYDFSTHQMLDESDNVVVAYGDRNLYTKKDNAIETEE